MTAESDPPDSKSAVDLAWEADFWLGASRVSPSTREVLRGADREFLEPRVMQVLVALFQADGRVVSRDELIARCWEGRIVGEDAINRAIGRLRRLSEVDREASFVIETIPRVGFRLMARQKLAAPEAGSGLAAAEPKNEAVTPAVMAPASSLLSHRPGLRLAAGLALLAVGASAVAAWLLWPQRHAPVLLFDGGLSAMNSVRFSPDGTKLAAASETTKTATVKIITRDGANLASFNMPSLGNGLPSWMPDGKAVLVFDRHSLRTMRIALDNIAQHSPIAPPHWVGIAVRKDGTFATRADRPGIWRIDGGIKQINSSYRSGSPLAFRGDDVLVPERNPGGTPRILAQPVAGGPSRAIAYAPGATSEFAVNPATGEIVYTARISHDTNIDLLTLARR